MMFKEKKTSLDIAALIEERIAWRATVVVMRGDTINDWYAQVVAPRESGLAELQAKVDQITDALRERYELDE
jgi:hypothetical protein